MVAGGWRRQWAATPTTPKDKVEDGKNLNGITAKGVVIPKPTTNESVLSGKKDFNDFGQWIETLHAKFHYLFVAVGGRCAVGLAFDIPG